MASSVVKITFALITFVGADIRLLVAKVTFVAAVTLYSGCDHFFRGQDHFVVA